MTLTEAFREVGRPLVFGDPKQIAAVELIAKVHGCVDATNACKHETRDRCAECGGSGEVDCECDCGHLHSKECDKCDGDGTLDGERGCERCLAAFDANIQMTARGVIKDGWPKGAKAA